MRKKSLLSLLMAIVCSWLLVLSGCSGDGAGGGVPISSGGGTVTMNGVTLEVPKDAVDPELTIKFTMTTEDALPGPLPADAAVASKTVVIAKDVPYNFYEPAKVTISYYTANLGPNDIPAVFYWDDDAKMYRAVGVKAVDTTNKTITFSTVHGGKFIAMGVKGLAADLGFTNYSGLVAPPVIKSVAPVVDTGFAPATDGFFHPNFGAYDSPGGSCLGMANFSVWYFSTAKGGNSNTGLYSMYKEADLSRWEDDLTARELISRAFMASSQSWAKSWMQKEYKIGPRWTGYLMIAGMKLSGPMTFLMADQWPGMTSGHAAVVYKYDTGKFYIYDDNFPGEVVTIDWGKDANGDYKFSNYSKNAAYNPPFTQFSFEGLSTAAETSQYKILYNGAQSGWSSKDSKFNTIAITKATDSKNNAISIDADGTIQLVDADTVKIEGTVTGGIKTAKYIIYRLNGGQRFRVNVTGGAFTINLPKITNGSNTLMLVATDDRFDEWNAYAGFKEVPIKIKGSLFFVNAGFESITPFDAWLIETHTWQNTTPGSFTPGKSAIVTAGMDAIATTINMVNVGKQSARVNNSDNNYHISSVSQSAVVPKLANPQVRFYWAAVLQDPQHAPAEQPYVDVVVTDETAGKQLYSKHFYSNDPAYPGWLTFGDWKAIPWQTITLSFTQAEIGNTIKVQFTAADCSLGGHGGYVYVDGDE